MRKYISILMVALVAIFVTSSCQLDGGNEPNPNRANNLLWGRVHDAINQHHEHFFTVAQLNDTLSGVVYTNSPYQPCELSVNGNIYNIVYGNPEYSSSRHYRIKTNGKRLDEGGEWIIYYRYGVYDNFIELGKAVGIVGETSKFNLTINTSGYDRYIENYVAESEIEYEYDELAECMIVRYNTFKGVSGDMQLSVSDSYVIEFNVVEPLIIRAMIEEGEVDILYKDFVENSSRSLTVQIANKIVTFVPKQ